MYQILYHRTTDEAATAILSNGFRDATGTYLTVNEYTGVWLSDQPLDANEGAFGDVLLCLVLDLSETDLAQYEWVEEGKGYREWLIPAAVVNEAQVSLKIVDRDETPPSSG